MARASGRRSGRRGRVGEAELPLSPAGMQVADVLQLQERAGNAATAGLLAGPRVQRFASSALSAPVAWGRETGDVARSGEGVSGGVYFLKSKNPAAPIPRLVVKPVFGMTGIGTESPEQLHLGDRALSSLLGISTPSSRTIGVGTKEFSELVGLLRPHQPAPPSGLGKDDEITWKDLGAARGFVVMGEVPQARSVMSFAEKAAGGGQAAADLHRTLFDPGFVGQLARICVGDLLLGNDDRMVLGAMNIGNVMISMQHGRGEAWAIDTTAKLPKAVDVAKLLDSGTASGGGFHTAQSAAAKPVELLDGFYERVIGVMKGADPGTSKGMPPWQVLEGTYQASKAAVASDFEFAWQSALIDILALVRSREGRSRMKQLTGAYGPGGQDVAYSALKANALYLAGMAEAKEHKEAAAEGAAYYGFKKLTGRQLDLLPPADRFRAGAAAQLPGEARNAEVPLPSALDPAILFQIARTREAFEPDAMHRLAKKMDQARMGLDGLGTKRRGFPGSRKEVPRHRALAGEFALSAFAVGGGYARHSTAYRRAELALTDLSALLDGSLKGSQAGKAADVAVQLQATIDQLLAEDGAYLAAIESLAATLPTMKRYPQGAELAAKLTLVLKEATQNRDRLTKTRGQVDAPAIAKALRTYAALNR